MTDTEIFAHIAREFGLDTKHVRNVVELLNDGATVPFIARYRKEATGRLDEVAVKKIQERLESLIELDKRKQTILASIESSGNLTADLRSNIEACFDSRQLEDYYLPFKPKRRTRASIARERGLEPLAKIIMSQRSRNLQGAAERFVNKDVANTEDALKGACDIIAEWVSEDTKTRSHLRDALQRHGTLSTKGDATGTKYETYQNFSRKLAGLPAHTFFALQRASNEGVLSVSVNGEEERDMVSLQRRFIHRDASAESAGYVNSALKDSYKRLLLPSITTEVMADVRERSDDVSIGLFADGLRQLLLYPPVKPQTVIAIDPGFRTGCKVTVLSPQGDLLDHCVIYPVEPVRKIAEAENKIKDLIGKYGCSLIALGDGTASRETEDFLVNSGIAAMAHVEKVSEQGASIYSASDVARREFPDLDLTFRSAVSIGRRLQDPLAELVKIDPKSIGVGQYQHDVNQTKLRDALHFTVERCVNEVGVNINTASVELLGYVAGIGPVLASNIVAYRKENGDFKSRSEIKKVPRLGAKAFEQSSGFLRIPGTDNPLDNSAVHPERYELVSKMARDLGCEVNQLIGNDELISKIVPEKYVGSEVGMDTIEDIISELKKPGRDPRESQSADWQDPSLRAIDQIRSGMILKGKVVNITAFGAFVDIGVKQSGLLHISELSQRRVTAVSDVLKLWQIVTVKVIDVDLQRQRISLSIKQIDG
ncbi:MAG: RNA-binding transcriptional accessory protein [Firmicutes bacterium]|nr:RNA-binding transcriptional accessory protein [Bacillota bacterium]MCM1400806.1 RNA-binding transcriptional accessory protein [Bacteroides sp.]MCM1477659.1 RNA-binding transcriptional accessory protein [Bacteroides sp.]